jgi:hypothetical protein
MTLNLRVTHRGGPYWAHITDVEEGIDKNTRTLKERGDEAEVVIWKGKSVTITESDPHEDDVYA